MYLHQIVVPQYRLSFGKWYKWSNSLSDLIRKRTYFLSF